MSKKEISKITISYDDGSEKVIDRGILFSIREDDKHLFLTFEGIVKDSEYPMDYVGALAIIHRIAQEAGLDEYSGKVKEVKKDEGE